MSDGSYEFGPYRLDSSKRLVTRDGESVTLAPKTYELLLLLVQSEGRALSKRELMSALWSDTFVEEANLSFQITALRKALGEEGNQWIETVPRHGYRFTVAVSKIARDGAPLDEPVSPHPKTPQPRRSLLLGLVAAISTTAALILAVLYFRQAPATEPMVRFVVAPPENVTLDEPSLSPDGERLAFFGREPDGLQRLWIRPLASLTAEPVPGAEGGNSAFWSPDSRSVGFFAAGKLKKIDLGGGSSQTLCDASNALRASATWSREGIILFNSFDRQGLYRVAAAGGKASAVTTLDSSRADRLHVWPQFLPDGRHFLYFVQSARPENTGIYIGSLDSNKSRQLINASAKPAYTRSSSGIGYLLFAQQTTLMAQRFDETRLQLVGEPFSIAEQVWLPPAPVQGFAAFSASANGVLAYRTGGSTATELIWFDRQGRRLGTVGNAGAYSNLSLSRDEKKLVVCRLDSQIGTRDLWLFDLVRGASSRLTFDPADETNPVWSPDGSRIAFNSSGKGTMDIYQKAATGASDGQPLLESREPKVISEWSPDGRYILYGTGGRNWALPPEGERKPIELLSISGNPRVSPNGRWFAYVSTESGRPEVHVQSFPPAGGKWQVSTTGGREPSWRADGKELFYVLGEKLMAVDVKTDSEIFEAGAPKPLFDVRLQPPIWRTRYQVAANGQRFLVNVPVDASSPSPITVVLNWASGMKP